MLRLGKKRNDFLKGLKLKKCLKQTKGIQQGFVVDGISGCQMLRETQTLAHREGTILVLSTEGHFIWTAERPNS